MLALDAEDDDISIAKIDAFRVVCGGYPNALVLDRGDEPQPIVLDGAKMRAAGDEHDLVAAVEEACANGSADPAGTVDDVPFGLFHNVRPPSRPN